MSSNPKPDLTSAPLPPDAAPAHQLWIELETRVTCQRLHYRVGNEEAAATSVSTLFETVRALLVAHPQAEVFQSLSIGMLNNVIRPYTGRWYGWITQQQFGEERIRRIVRHSHAHHLAVVVVFGIASAVMAVSGGNEALGLIVFVSIASGIGGLVGAGLGYVGLSDRASSRYSLADAEEAA